VPQSGDGTLSRAGARVTSSIAAAVGLEESNAINDNDVMVGGSSIDSGGTIQDLNSLIPARSGDQITDATAINDNGQIVAKGSDATTSQAALLLTPA